MSKCISTILSFIILFGVNTSAFAGLEIPLPVGATYITQSIKLEDVNYEARYTDCMEISLLRLIQTLLIDISSSKTVDLHQVEKSSHDSFRSFFKKHSDIHSKAFYSTHEGIAFRTEWATLLSNQKNFRYILSDKFELQATWSNFIEFFRTFFADLNLSGQPSKEQEDLDVICSSFSRKGFLLSCSRTVETTPFGKDKDFVVTNIQFNINDSPALVLELYEDFREGKRYTGHAELSLPD